MKILCNINLFALESPIYVIDDNDQMEPIVSAMIEELPEIIAALAHTRGIADIKLAGCQAYGEALKTQIYEYTMQHYNSSNLNIEIL